MSLLVLCGGEVDSVAFVLILGVEQAADGQHLREHEGGAGRQHAHLLVVENLHRAHCTTAQKLSILCYLCADLLIISLIL